MLFLLLVTMRTDITGSSGRRTYVRPSNHRGTKTRQCYRQQAPGESAKHLVQQAWCMGIHGSNGCKVSANAIIFILASYFVINSRILYFAYYRYSQIGRVLEAGCLGG